MTDDADGGETSSTSVALPGELLDLVDEALVMFEQDGGTVRGFNRAAARLFPLIRVGEQVEASAAGPLAHAVTSGTRRFTAEHEGRVLDGSRHTADGLVVWLVREISSVREADAMLLGERSRSAFLEEATKRLGASLHHGRTLRTLTRIALPELADASVVVLPPTGPRMVWHRAGPGEDRTTGQMSSETLEQVPKIADALHGLRPRPVALHPHEMEALGQVLPADLTEGGDALVVQLAGGGTPAGALILLRGPQRARFDDADTELARQFAVRAGLALTTAALYSQQAHTIRVLQTSMAPEPLPSADGLALGAAYRPAAEGLRISGDFYHVASRPGEGVNFFFGDVSGKGAEAAVLATQVRQSMRTLALITNGSEPLRELQLLNEVVIDDGHRFTTLVTGSARPRGDGSVEVDVADGGHLPPLVLRGDGGVEEITCDGMVVGAVHDPRFGRTQFRLEPGELMLLYSDGITEARGGADGREMYGDERLAGALAECLGMQAASVAERLELLTTQWLAGRPHDDISVLALQAPPRHASPPHERPAGSRENGAGPGEQRP